MIKNLLWRIYYGDGTTFDNLKGSSFEAPPYNIQVIVSVDKTVGRFLLHSLPYYWFKNNEWYSGDIGGVFDLLVSDYKDSFEFGTINHKWDGKPIDILGLFKILADNGIIKFGKTLTNETYYSIFNKATEDLDFPIKSAFHPREMKA